MTLKIVMVSFLMVMFLTPMVWAQIRVAGVGNEAQGAGTAITNLDKNPRPELILMAYGNFLQPGSFRYKIGWNLNTDGETADWGNHIEVPGVGSSGQGAGVAIAQLDNNPKPDMILMVYENPQGANFFGYKIGWNLNYRGEAAKWSTYIKVPGVGWEGSGAGAVITQLDNDERPEMIFMTNDNPPKDFHFIRYRIGWNLDTKGKAAKWSYYMETLGVNNKGFGAGTAITQLDNNEKPEIIFMAYDLDEKQDSFRYRIGWNLNHRGEVARWSNYLELPGICPGVKGVDFSVFNLDDVEKLEFIFTAYSTSGKNGSFHYTVLKNQAPAKRIYLEADKLDSVRWLPARVNHGNAVHSLQGIYTVIGIDLDPVHDEGSIVDIKPGKPYRDVEVHSFLTYYMNDRAAAGTSHMYGAFLTSHQEGIPGMMFAEQQQRGIMVFTGEFPSNEQYLRTTSHEIGHALNLQHSDGDAFQGNIMPGKGYTIMNPPWALADDWNFTWSAASLCHFYNHMKYGNRFPFPSNTTSPKKLELTIRLEMDNYLVGVPIILYVSLTNTGPGPTEVMQFLEPEFGFVEYVVSAPASKEFIFSPWTHKDHAKPFKILSPGESITTTAKIFFGSKGWTFLKSGEYHLKAFYMNEIQSNSLSISILTPYDDNLEKAVDLILKSKEVGYFYLFEGGDHLEYGIRRLEAVTEIPAIPIHSSFANFVLGANLMRDFANFKEKHLRKANFERAAAYLEKAKLNKYSVYRILYSHLYLAEAYKKMGQRERAHKVLKQELPTAMENFSGFKIFQDDILKKVDEETQ
jgi:hypothetical protein